MLRRNVLLTMAIIVIAALVFTGCQRREAPDSGRMRVALLLSGPANDQGWNAVAFQGLQEAEAQYNLITAYMENVGIPDSDAAFTDFASQGFDLVIGHGFHYGDPAVRVSARFPNTKFMAIESNVYSDNAASYVMACEEGGYLMGILAASMSNTGIIGIVGAIEQPSIIKIMEAYKLGARLYNPDIVILDAYVNSYTDVTAGMEAALSMADRGADVLGHVANQAGTGVIMAAQERGLLATGDSWDQNVIAPDTIICSTIYNVPKVVLTAVEKVRNGTFESGVFNLGMREGIVDIAPYYNFEGRIPQRAKDMVADLKARITRGEYTVPVIERRTN